MSWIVASALGLLGWWALLRGTPHGLGGRAPGADWGRGEAMLAGFLGFYFLLLIVGGGQRADPSNPAPALTIEGIWGGLAIYGVLLTLLLVFLARRGHSPVRVFGLAPAHGASGIAAGIGIAVAFGVAGLAATYPIVEGLAKLAGALGHSVSEGDEMVRFFRGPLSALERATVIALAVIVAPITEEVIFRGFLYGVMKRYFGALAAMGASALLFAAIHQNVPAIPALFALGVGFTLIYERAGSLWAPIAMHMLFNATSVALILFFPEWIPDR